MKIITTDRQSKFIQSWNKNYLPTNYAWLPDSVDITEFYQYNGFVDLTMDGDTVTAMTVNTEAYDAWQATLPDPAIEAAAEVRSERDTLIAATDWTQVLDAPLSTDCVAEFRVYRQALRDITEQEGFPLEVTWPEVPETVKDEADPVDEAFDELVGGGEDE